jgi:hypothetical protein
MGYFFAVALPPDTARGILLTLMSNLAQFLGSGFRALGGG